jgi:hypothetical protein
MNQNTRQQRALWFPCGERYRETVAILIREDSA